MRIHLKIPLTVKEIAAAINSPLHYPQNTVIDTITTSSKEVCRGDLFVALKGENFDGKDFIPEALERGAYVMSDLYDN